MFAMFSGTANITCNSTVSNSTIITSSIDMNGAVITNGGTPVNPGDLVNKAYADALVISASGSVISTVTVTLTSTTYTTVISNTVGCFTISVKNVITGGPCATFTLTKNVASKGGNITRTSSSAGLNTYERLSMLWAVNGGIQLKKTGTNYDGTYTCKIISNG
jgi:hypothetical protein